MDFIEYEVNGKCVRDYTILAGDTFPVGVKLFYKNEPIDIKNVASFKVKIGDKNNKLLIEEDFKYLENLEKWYAEISSEKTATLIKGKFIYEYELTLTNNFVITIMRGNLKVIAQNGGGVESGR